MAVPTLLEAAQKFSLDRRIGASLREWMRGRRQGALSLDAERRLVVGEWIAAHPFELYRPPHLVAALSLAPVCSVDVIRQRLDRAIARHPRLQVHFEAAAHANSEERDQLLGRAIHSGVVPSGLHRAVQQPVAPRSVPLAHQVVAHASLTSEEAIERAYADAVRPFNTGSAPLIRALVLEESPAKRLLVLTLHKLIADWRTFELIAEELVAPQPSEHQRSFNVPDGHPEHDNRRDQRRSLEYLLTRWDNYRLPLLRTEDFPTALPQGDADNPELAFVVRHLPSSTRDAIERVSRQTNCTCENVLQSAVLLALYHATQRTNIGVWCDFHHRPTTDVSAGRTFSHPIAVDMSLARSFADVPRVVAQAQESAAAHAQIPLELIWRIALRSWQPTGGQVSYQHLRVPPHDDGSVLTNVIPLFDTDAMCVLQFRTWDDGLTLALSCAFVKATFDRSSILELLEDANVAIELLVLACDGQLVDDSPAVQQALARDPTACPLCSRRPVHCNMAPDSCSVSAD